MNRTDTADPNYYHKVVDCQWACPSHTNVPEYIRMIAQGRFDDAYILNRECLRLHRCRSARAAKLLEAIPMLVPRIRTTPSSSPAVGPLTTAVGVAASRDVSARDADGTVTGLTIDSVSPSPSPGTITVTGVVPATTAGGTATGTVAVSDTVPAGTYSVTLKGTSNHATPQSGTCTLTVNVVAVKTIGEVQGTTLDT